MRALAILLAVVGAYRVRRSGLGVRDVKGVMRNIVQGSMVSLVQVWELVKKQVTV
jgi:hypothetical protein